MGGTHEEERRWITNSAGANLLEPASVAMKTISTHRARGSLAVDLSDQRRGADAWSGKMSPDRGPLEQRTSLCKTVYTVVWVVSCTTPHALGRRIDQIRKEEPPR